MVAYEQPIFRPTTFFFSADGNDVPQWLEKIADVEWSGIS